MERAPFDFWKEHHSFLPAGRKRYRLVLQFIIIGRTIWVPAKEVRTHTVGESERWTYARVSDSFNQRRSGYRSIATFGAADDSKTGEDGLLRGRDVGVLIQNAHVSRHSVFGDLLRRTSRSAMREDIRSGCDDAVDGSIDHQLG